MKVTCPKCGSDQISANKKGFSGGKAAAGAIMTGGIGLLAGTIGSSKVICTCLACGGRFKAGQGKIIYEAGEQPPAPTMKQQLNARAAKSKGLRTFALVLLALALVMIIGMVIASL